MTSKANGTPTIKRSVTHSTFVIDRDYDATPARVFNAFANPKTKAQWFGGPEEWGPAEFTLDFRIGGRETSRGGPLGGPVHTYQAIYQDIVPNERIVLSYDLLLDDSRISVSLQTFEFLPKGKGTRLILTEYGVYLDGNDNPAEREHGTRELLDALGATLARQETAA